MLEFYLERQQDGHELSGKGKVAKGYVFEEVDELKKYMLQKIKDKKVLLEWIKEPISIGAYRSLEDLLELHGHEVKTVVVFKPVKAIKRKKGKL